MNFWRSSDVRLKNIIQPLHDFSKSSQMKKLLQQKKWDAAFLKIKNNWDQSLLKKIKIIKALYEKQKKEFSVLEKQVPKEMKKASFLLHQQLEEWSVFLKNFSFLEKKKKKEKSPLKKKNKEIKKKVTFSEHQKKAGD